VTLDDSVSITYGYDNNGNLTSRTSEGQTTYYHYNLQNRLEIVDYASGDDVQYFYDAIGRKYMATYGTYSGGSLTGVQDSLTGKYVYAGGVVIAELDNSDNLVKEYVRGLSLGGGIGGILYCKDGSNFYYYHYDGNGNVTSVTDGDGKEVAIYEYDCFGNVLTEAASLSNDFKFSTKQADKRGQLIDFGARWYDPEVGRWTQRDPLGVAGGLNLYGYCNGNPLNLIDPWGLDWTQEVWEDPYQTPIPGRAGQWRGPGNRATQGGPRHGESARDEQETANQSATGALGGGADPGSRTGRGPGLVADLWNDPLHTPIPLTDGALMDDLGGLGDLIDFIGFVSDISVGEGASSVYNQVTTPIDPEELEKLKIKLWVGGGAAIAYNGVQTMKTGISIMRSPIPGSRIVGAYAIVRGAVTTGVGVYMVYKGFENWKRSPWNSRR